MEYKPGGRLVSYGLQGTFIVMAATTLLIPLFAFEKDGAFFALIFYVPLGIVQLGDALIGAIKGVRWRRIYFFSAITYLFMIKLAFELPLSNYGIDEAFIFISLLILPGMMALSYWHLTSKEI